MNVNQPKYLRTNWFVIPMMFLFFIILLITAWLSDDAYITLRTVDNFINGYGLTWNIEERVQTFTHPLWTMLLIVFQLITREAYFTSIVLSAAVSLLAFYILISRLSISAANSIIAGLILIFSKAFIDYSTSGLENPLSHLLIVLFYVIYFNYGSGQKKIFFLSLIVSFAALNRLDIIIILLPSLFLFFYNIKDKIKSLPMVLAGLIPFFLWELFSIFYYGFPFPNTAFAKLNTGISRSELIEQGFLYLLDSLYMDPLTFFSLIILLLLPLVKRKPELIPISLGVGLYLIYVVYIGGDFMSGRFLTVPLFTETILLSRIEIKSNKLLLFLSAAIIVMGFFSPRPNLLNSPSYSLGPKIINGFRFGPTIVGMKNGITDERFWYYENTGLLNNLSEKKIDRHPWAKHGIKIKETKIHLVVKATVGLFGFYAGRNVQIVDQYALTEPLLARLPATEYWLIGKEKPAGEKFWRIGHFARKIPDGYLETLKRGENKIVDPSLAKYYEKLSIIIKSDLWDLNRLKEIWNFNTGKYDYLVDSYSKTLNQNSD